MNPINILRAKNRLLGYVAPKLVAKQNASLFLSPRKLPAKDWEQAAEQAGQRQGFDSGLSALRWGQAERRILIMHGWESRATQMYNLATALLKNNFEVIAIDGPGHGQSQGKKSNPVEFAQAVAAADQAFGPFYGAIGHSMGASALAIARGQGIDLGQYALISSPACLYDTLWAFAKFMGLSDHCSQGFIQAVETEVGRPAKDLDMGALLSQHQQPILLMHSQDDIEVPFACLNRIRQQLTQADIWCPENLGHRKIVRAPEVSEIIQQFFTNGRLLKQENQKPANNASQLDQVN